MDIVRRTYKQISDLEHRNPGFIILLLLVLILFVLDIFSKQTISDLRYMWLRLYEVGGRGLFQLFGIGSPGSTDAIYDPDTRILSVKYQLISVLAIYVLASGRSSTRLIFAVSWLISLQILAILKYTLVLLFLSGNPDHTLLLSEESLHFIQSFIPFVLGWKRLGTIGITRKPEGSRKAPSYYELQILRVMLLLLTCSDYLTGKSPICFTGRSAFLCGRRGIV
jgi:hypothetical protein